MATSWVALDDANGYFAQRMNTEAWDLLTDDQKDAALVHATRIIDRLNFAGDKADPDQILQFPRGTDTEVPQDIQDATCEVALALVEGVDPDVEISNLNVTSHGISTARTTYDRSSIPNYIRAGIPSAAAWAFLFPYLRDPHEVAVHRIS